MDTSEEEEEAHKTTCTSYMRHNMWGTEKGGNCTVSTTRAASEQLAAGFFVEFSLFDCKLYGSLEPWS